MTEKKKEEKAGVEKKAAEKKAAKPLVINRGRMPILLVAMARFNFPELTVPACAKTFCTTVGKISDIRKVRNFGYVTDAYKPTQEDMDAAVAHVEESMKLVPEDKALFTDLIKQIRGMKIATAAETAAFEELKAGSRKRTPKAEKAEGEKVAETPEAKQEAKESIEDAELADLVA